MGHVKDHGIDAAQGFMDIANRHQGKALFIQQGDRSRRTVWAVGSNFNQVVKFRCAEGYTVVIFTNR